MIASLLIGFGLIACTEQISKYEARRFAPTPPLDAPQVSIQWFGAAFVLIDDGTSAIIFDPFVSRGENQPLDILFGREAVVDSDLIIEQIETVEFGRATSIFVGHSHYDHSLDVAAFSHALKVPVFGSPSTQRILKNSPHTSFEVIKDGALLPSSKVGKGFTVRVLKGEHGAPPFFVDPLDEKVASDFQLPAAINRYGLGEVNSFVVTHSAATILHIGSAGVANGELDNLSSPVDIVLLPLVGRPNTKDYLAAIVGKLRPKVVIPIHFDNIFIPLDEPIRVVVKANLAEFFELMEQEYPDVETGLLHFGESWHYGKKL